MAVTAVAPRQGELTASAAALPCLVAAGIYVVVLTVGQSLLNDPDSYWHVLVGGWIAVHGFPWTDPFSFTFAGRPWIAKEWLSQLLYVGAFRLAGWSGVVVLAASAIAVAFALLARLLAERLTTIAILVFVAMGFMLMAPHALARPHILALPIMVAWVGGLLFAADRGKSPSNFLMPLMVLWANLHGGFVFGIFMVGAVGLDAIASAEQGKRWQTAERWVLFGLVALVAACVTPYGPKSLLAAWQVLSLGPALAVIGEWKPADFSQLAGLELALLAGIGFALWRGITLPWPRIAILVGLIHMALSSERNAELLGLIAPLVLAAPLARQMPQIAATGENTRRLDMFAGIALALLIPVTAAFAGFSDYRPASAITPTAAVDALKATNAKRVFNSYDFGGYLLAEGVPTFIDGRTELYGAKFMQRYVAAVSLADFAGFERTLDTWDIGATLLRPGTPAVALLDTLPQWQRVYADDIAIVHVRTPLRPSLP